MLLDLNVIYDHPPLLDKGQMTTWTSAERFTVGFGNFTRSPINRQMQNLDSGKNYVENFSSGKEVGLLSSLLDVWVFSEAHKERGIQIISWLNRSCSCQETSRARLWSPHGTMYHYVSAPEPVCRGKAFYSPIKTMLHTSRCGRGASCHRSPSNYKQGPTCGGW